MPGQFEEKKSEYIIPKASFFSSQPESNPPAFNLSSNKKVHPAIKYFHQLQRATPLTQLQAYLADFSKPKSIDSETFVEGVKKFIQLANSNPADEEEKHSRKGLYGNNDAGLHYNNDLVKMWNASNVGDKSIKASQVSTLAASGWDSTCQDGFNTLIYKGQQPAQALDELVKGPTVIDCGMFSQLSLWFGIRYMLGNERFNQCFGRAPFFITQVVYNAIGHSYEPYSGSPLYSFLSTIEKAEVPTVTVKHIANSPLYPLKHPGGNYDGENCIVIGDNYYIFDPHLENTQGLTESAVMELLRQSFNEERKQYDDDRLALYAENPGNFHPPLSQTFGELIKMADELRDTKLEEEEFFKVVQNPALELTFDLHKFSKWLKALESNALVDASGYSSQAIDHARLPGELLKVIPFENKLSMDFYQFKQATSQQKELMALSMQFCKSMVAGESKLLILSGKAGVGKTASAVCAAKELAAIGKKVAWISEVMVHGWAAQAESIADLDKCGLEIDNLLATNPDVVFLDDDNLAGFNGQLLLEKLYSWYVENPGKGLLITSNEPIQFKNCYGYKLDGQYHYPPFSDYHSAQYLNWQHKTDLSGESLRSKRDGQSIGAIVSDSVWKSNEGNLRDVELIPGFDYSIDIAPICRSLHATCAMGDAYDKLRPIQQRWLRVYGVGHGNLKSANSKNFEKSTCKTIALEMREDIGSCYGYCESMGYLISVLNYAHDQGGRRIILINQTSFSTEQLLAQIKKNLPSSERERTWSRLMLLLCETEDSIFKCDGFDGHVENDTTKSDFDSERNNGGYHPDFCSGKPTIEDRFLSDRLGRIKPAIRSCFEYRSHRRVIDISLFKAKGHTSSEAKVDGDVLMVNQEKSTLNKDA